MLSGIYKHVKVNNTMNGNNVRSQEQTITAAVTTSVSCSKWPRQEGRRGKKDSNQLLSLANNQSSTQRA